MPSSSVNKRVGLGFLIAMDPAGGSSYSTATPVIGGFKGPGAKAENPDTTLLSETIKTCGKGQVDPGEVTLTVLHDPDNTTCVNMVTALNSTSQVPQTFKVTYPSGSGGSGTITTESFAGFIAAYDRTVEKDKSVTADVTIKLSGDHGYCGV